MAQSWRRRSKYTARLVWARQTAQRTLAKELRTLRLLSNTGTERLFELLQRTLEPGGTLDVMSAGFGLFAYAALRPQLAKLTKVRLLVPPPGQDLGLLGGDDDRQRRNQLQARWLAEQATDWLATKVELRAAQSGVPQGLLVVRDRSGAVLLAVAGSLALATDGLGLAPGNPLALLQQAETDGERLSLSLWFDQQWQHAAKHRTSSDLPHQLTQIAARRAPADVYALVLHHLLAERGGELDEERVLKSATGIRQTRIWQKLYRFQRDAVVGAIDKLERFGGCIIADSVGLGKTFEALGVIKYHELRNDRVLVLCPKRLYDNWALYRNNDRRNVLLADRLNYDVLCHTDLSRDRGHTGDIDLSHVHWGNYDLVVIDESHNFRNKKSPRAGVETRYDRLLRQIVREGVRTRVLMLSATPVNSRIADLRNQIAFATEGRDDALGHVGIASIDETTRSAQKAFNSWLALAPPDRTPGRLIEVLGFDYFTLLDLLTIARSRKHIVRYYGTAETGKFPDRLPPINVYADLDRDDQLPSIEVLNDEIRSLRLAAYTPLDYVLKSKKDAYDKKYSTQLKDGKGQFHQSDRDRSLINLLRVNLLKRMESALCSFGLTVQRLLADVTATLAKIDGFATVAPTGHEELEPPAIDDLDTDDPQFESMLAGRKVKVLLHDVDAVRWRQDLAEDRNRLQTLLQHAQAVGPERDQKLAELRQIITAKCKSPINAGNKKTIVFTAFSDTAGYLYEQIAPWALRELGLHTGLVTGSGRNQTTLPGLHRDMASLLSAFAPRAKERPDDLAAEGELDLLIATDCISEGQNLQDCDQVVSYDIHWNPVRIIQRFGRIDRLGSPNTAIQLVNFWPNMELEKYIKLERRVSGRMVLLDVSAAGEENLLEYQSSADMNDLEYRRKQLIRLKEAVLDLEDLPSGLSIADLTLGDFRLDLGGYMRQHGELLANLPLGCGTVTVRSTAATQGGAVFCLKAVTERLQPELGYPLHPLYLVQVSDDGEVVSGHLQAKLILDTLRDTCLGRDLPDPGAWSVLEHETRSGSQLRHLQGLLSTAIAAVVGKAEERAVHSLFNVTGSHALPGELAGGNDFEVVAWLRLLPAEQGAPVADVLAASDTTPEAP
jgi:hypothetical protein